MFSKLVDVPIFLVIVASSAGAQDQGPAKVLVDAVRRETVQESRRCTGELRPIRRSRVATREDGLVLDLPVQEGQRVEAGHVLARLDSRLLELEVQQLEAEQKSDQEILDERKATWEWRQRELELYRQSAERGAANIKEILDAETTARIADARVRQAERQADMTAARLGMLRERLSDMTVKAPFTGVVVAKLAELGEWVGEGAALVELVSVGEIEAWLDVPQRYFAAVTARSGGIAIRLEAGGGTMEVDRLRVVPQVDPRARSFSIVAALDDDGGRLAPGMSLVGWIPTGQTAERLTVDRNAVLHNEAGTAYVYAARWRGAPTADAPAIATPVNVEELFPIRDRVVVEARDLKEGDLVVVEGNERLFVNMPILAMQAGPGAPGGDRR